MAFIFDDNLMPSLLSQGASVGHHELMGRGHLPQLQPSRLDSHPPPAAFKPAVAVKPAVAHDNIPRSSSASPPAKLRKLQRASTLELPSAEHSQQTNHPSKSFAVSTRYVKKDRHQGAPMSNTPPIAIAGAKTVLAPRRLPSLPAPVGKRDVIPDGPTRPSTKHVNALSQAARSPLSACKLHTGATWQMHARSSSWSQPTPLQVGRNPSRQPTAPSFKICVSPERCIALWKKEGSRDEREISKAIAAAVLADLYTLIPPSRLDPLTPPSSEGNLYPPALIASLAFVLEAIVAERTALTPPSSASSSDTPKLSRSATPLPELGRGVSLQVATSRGGSGELDWTETYRHILRLGQMLDQLIPLLLSLEVSQPGLELIDTVVIYLNKIRKVFGEVAGRHQDSYSFMTGWWTHSDMEQAGAEIQRWASLVGIK